ncbi:MAG: hypothetical protein MUF47_01005 [Porphyrobacter sp.]|jgi:hypothetical protein|nr:hypothetical protein [Porphyrobacter sp.]
MNFHGTDANRAIVAFFGAHSAALPDHTRDKLTEALVSPDALGAIITTTEALYAARADLGEAGIELLGGLARFVGANNFYGKGLRAALIAGVAARIADGGAPELTDDPAIEAGFCAPQPASEPEAPAETN